MKAFVFLWLFKNNFVNFVNPEIISNDQIKIRIQVKETLQIYQYSKNKSLNVNIDSFECKLW